MHRALLPARWVSAWMSGDPDSPKLATPSSVTARIRARSAISAPAAGGRLAEDLRRCRGDLVRRDIAELLSDVPAVAERIAELSVELTPELLGERVKLSAPASSAWRHSASAASVVIWSTVAVPPIERGERMPAAGNSLPM